MLSTFLTRSMRWLVLASMTMMVSGLAAADAPYIFTTIAGNSPLTGPLQRFAWPLGLTIDHNGVMYVADGDHAVVFKVTPAGEVSVLAGKSAEYATIDGPAATARFNTLLAVAVDGSGNVFAADNHTIRKITPTGDVSTFTGVAGENGTADGMLAAARFGEISSLVFDAAGNLYAVDDGCVIRKITPAGVVSTLAGQRGEHGHVDSIGAAARFGYIAALAVDAAGNLYASDSLTVTIRRISTTGVVSTFAGSAGQVGAADGMGSVARFGRPMGLTVDSAGTVFVGDAGNHTLRKITPSGLVSTVAGKTGLYGGLDGTGEEARFVELSALIADPTGNVLATDSVEGTIRKITPAGVVTTLVGTGRDNALESIDGPDSAAQLAPLLGLAIAPNRDVFIADNFHSVIRKVPAGGKILTFAGGMDERGLVDGPGADARFTTPEAVAVAADGTVFVADTGNDCVRKITPAGIVSTLTDLTGDYNILDGIGDSPAFRHPTGIAVDAAGTLYLSDSGNYIVRKITAAGVVSTLAGRPRFFGEVDGTGRDAMFYNLGALVLDGSGNLYVLDRRISGAVVRKITPAGVVTTVAGTQGATGLTVDAAGNVFVAGAVLTKISPLGIKSAVASKDATGKDVTFESTGGISLDATGNLFVAAGRAVHKGQPAAAPAITAQPRAASVRVGDAVKFTVEATGLPAPTYQWFVNGAPFQGATTSELSFSNARAADAGNYSVVISNLMGSTTSSVAKLSVSAPAPAPSPGSGTSAAAGSGKGGGGGAPSLWFLLALSNLAWLRWLRRGRMPARA